MKTMIVIDDEILVRIGIRETIPWSDYGITLVGEAANGRAGLELIEKLRPDIVLTDVKMPFLDGVELTRAVFERKLDLAVVILSGFKDFDFAKGALEHGACEYLLKPIDNDELVAAVLRTAARLDAERLRDRKAATLDAELPAIRTALLTQLLEQAWDPALALRVEAAGIAVPPFGRILCGVVDAPETMLDPRQLAAVVADLEEALVAASGGGLGVRRTAACFVLTAADGDDTAWTDRLRAALRRFETLRSDLVSLAFSRPYEGLQEIHAAAQTAQNAARNKAFPATSTIAGPTSPSQPWKPLVTKAMALIAADYASPLTVKRAADRLYVSESYLLHTFRRETGVTFNECLTNYRLLMAKRLLLKGAYKVYEVAGRVGYADEKYFATVFRKAVGMTPSEYAERGAEPRP